MTTCLTHSEKKTEMDLHCGACGNNPKLNKKCFISLSQIKTAEHYAVETSFFCEECGAITSVRFISDNRLKILEDLKIYNEN